MKKDTSIKRLFWKSVCLFIGHTSRVFDQRDTKKWICWRCKKPLPKGK